MDRFDVFNGDADGLCALQQLRLAQPGETTPVSYTHLTLPTTILV